MRIISGSSRGKRIMAPKRLPVRPTTDMAKEGLFNILNNHYYFHEVAVLDLFAGTGNISYEFASRGTKNIIAVDAHASCIKFITKMATELNFDIEAVKSDVYKYLKNSRQASDIIFADPPYDFHDEGFSKLTSLVFEYRLLAEKGTLIIEHSSHTELSRLKGFKRKRKYGSSVFSFFDYS